MVMKSGDDAGMKMLSSLLSHWPHRRHLSSGFLVLLLLLQCGGGLLPSSRSSHGGGGGLVRAQQAPNASLQMEAFAAASGPTGSSFRQDFCTLSRSANLTNIGTLLQGVALHTNILLGEFIKFDNGDEDNFDNDQSQMRHMILHPDYPGLMARIMDELCLRAGCTWRNSYSIIGAIPDNATWSDLLYWSTDMYDISVEWWMRSTERMRHGAAFIEPWYDSSIIMVTKSENANGNGNGDEQFNAGSWLLPFDNYVWLMIVVTIFVSALIYWFLEVLNPDSDHRNYQLDPLESIWLLGTAFAGQFEFDPQTGPARLLTFSIAFWALLMGAAYTANLASFLVVKNKPQLVIESIEQAVRLNIPMCVYAATLTHQTIQKRFPAYARSGLLIPMTVERDVFQEIGTSCQIAITEISTWKTFQHNELVNGDCSLYWVGRAYDFIPASFAVKADSGNKCTSLIKTVFDVHMHDMSKEGKLAELWEEHLQATGTVFCEGGAAAGSGDGSNSDNGAKTGRRFLHADDHHVGRALPKQATDPAAAPAADNDGRYVRHLNAAETADSSQGGGGNNDSDTTQLTLLNMGGVFLLHGVLSGVALICALISWSTKDNNDHSKAKAGAARKEQGASGNEQSNIRDTASSSDQDEFFDASTSAEEFRQKMANKPLENGSGKITNGNHLYSSTSNAAVDDLRTEMKQQLRRIDQKLAALLDRNSTKIVC